MKKKYFLLLSFAVFIFGCANRGIGPQGGPKDERPPLVLKETPLNSSTNQQQKDIELVFDEIVVLENTADNILSSPPQKNQPTIKAYSKKIKVHFEDDFIDSTTYTIDFGNAIVDNNEKNVLHNYTYSFSTGDVIDTLQISGQILYAENLNPMSGIIVGIHSNLEDSALSKLQFNRIAKTDTTGRFTIRNIRPQSYRLYALADVNKDYIYQMSEGLAWCDSIITPSSHQAMLSDTIWFDPEIIDSIRLYQGTVYEPRNIKMLFSYEDLTHRYFVRTNREKQHSFQLFFSAPQPQQPRVKPIGQDTIWYNYSICQPNKTFDTITYWLTDSLAMNIDTIQMEMTYFKTDSIFNLEEKTDTIKAVYRHPRTNKKNQNKTQKIERVGMKTDQKNAAELHRPLRITFDTPIADICLDSIHFTQKVDSTERPIPFSLTPQDSSKMVYFVTLKNKSPFSEYEQLWEPQTSYTLQLDSGALHDIYGNTINKQTIKWTTKSFDDYSTLKIILKDYDSTAMLQLLDEKDKVVRTLPAQPEGTLFRFIAPKDYYLRLYLDTNHDGEWTPASWAKKQQPEAVYYFPNKLTLRANWDFEETWEHTMEPNRKPKELIKDESLNKKK